LRFAGALVVINAFEDVLHGFLEAHVEHSVDFVKHYVLHFGQVDFSRVDEV
jgi:hypothetical protein